MSDVGSSVSLTWAARCPSVWRGEVGRKEAADLRYVEHRIQALEREVDEHGDLLQEHGETLGDHENRIMQVEGVLKEVLTRLDELGDYKRMSTEQLHVVQGEIAFMLKIVSSVVANSLNTAGLHSAKALQLRIKKNAGYINTALNARVVGQ